MEGIGGDGTSLSSPLSQWGHDAWRIYQYYLDKTTPHTAYRWIGTLVIVAIYCLRVYYVQGFYIISYGLGIYLLNLLIGFLSPLVDPEVEVSDGPLLPTKGSDEFKPFIRRLPEFKFCILTVLEYDNTSSSGVVLEVSVSESRNTAVRTLPQVAMGPVGIEAWLFIGESIQTQVKLAL
ncbi:hypothetical protein V6N11_021466 [Hibiscus sabdariffa]|uniref:Uncharacterized protein n=1 Tax=Hibiscus sabdariffa TaxID=183260 RepID=A0ABR1ZAP1_9ROSI